MLERFDMQNCKPTTIFFEQKLNYTDDAEVMIDARKFRDVVGNLVA